MKSLSLLIISFTFTLYLFISCEKERGDCMGCETDTITDVDGNIYQTVKIGGQWWMAENLKTTRYNDGTDIPLVTDYTEWINLSTPAYCWYNNNEAYYKNPYGALYNWHTVNTCKLCPTGWHVPTDSEWITLETYLGGPSVAGGKMKETGSLFWVYPNTGATNESGFSALPGGHRIYEYADGDFRELGYLCRFWSATDSCYRSLHYDKDYVGGRFLSTYTWFGLSVRCVKD